MRPATLSHSILRSSLTKKSLLNLRTIATKRPELPPLENEPDLVETKLGRFEVERIHKLNLNPCLKAWYSEPLLLTQGYKQYVWDSNKKRYLDMFGGIVTTSVGHAHPRLVEVVSRQARKLWHVSSIYLTEEVHEYANKLANHFPDPLNNVIFCNSGSEANDIALLMARLYTGAYDIIALHNAYHGCTTSTMPLCGIGSWKFSMPLSFGIHHVTLPDPYGGRVGGRYCRDSPVLSSRTCDCKDADSCQATDYYIEDFLTTLNGTLPKRIAGFFAESVQGVGGTVQYPRNYLKKAHQLVKERGGLFISDEVQTGFGRTGTHFWGFQGHGIMPDIVTMAKGIGNGFPMGAVVTTQSVAQTLSKASYFNTFGGNPMASVIGSTVLDIIDQERLQDNSHQIGTLLLTKLAELRDGRYSDIIGDVRGKGLMIGLELSVNGKPMPSSQFEPIFEDCRELGLIVGKGGPHGNVFRIKPPMCITADDVQFTIDVFRCAFENHYKRLAHL
ncbi:alanine--glyoxylate aminotransferase 2 [Blomia tropicalis]|nr:alanine--glyoxylate aminotransferase 2 [Blomia tropicalis]